MDQATHNKIVSCTMGIPGDVLLEPTKPQVFDTKQMFDAAQA